MESGTNKNNISTMKVFQILFKKSRFIHHKSTQILDQIILRPASFLLIQSSTIPLSRK